MKDVRLVLRRIGPSGQSRPRRRVDDAGVMAGGDPVEAECVGAPHQPVELQVPVALDARVRRPTRSVVVDVGADDLALEVFAEVEHVMLDPEPIGDPTGVVDVADGTAPGVGRSAPQLHRHADDLVAGLKEQGRGDGRVDPARHHHEDRPTRGGRHLSLRRGPGAARPRAG